MVLKRFLVAVASATLVLVLGACSSSPEFSSLRGSPDQVLDRIALSLAQGDPTVLNDIVGSMRARQIAGSHYRFLPSEGVGGTPEIDVDKSADGDSATAWFLFSADSSLRVELERSQEGRRGFIYSLDQYNLATASFPFGAAVGGTPVPAGTYRLMPGDLPPTTVNGDPSGWLNLTPASLPIGRGSEFREWEIQGWLDSSKLSAIGEAELNALQQDLCTEAKVFFEGLARFAIAESGNAFGADPGVQFDWNDCETRADYFSVRVTDISPGSLTELWNSPGEGRVDDAMETLPVLFVPIIISVDLTLIRPGETALEDSLSEWVEVLVVSRDGRWEILDSTDYQYSYRWESWENQILF